MGHKSLWQVGLSYLDHCPYDGLQVIETLLPRIYPENEAKVQKILREAKSRSLHNVGKIQPFAFIIFDWLSQKLVVVFILG